MPTNSDQLWSPSRSRIDESNLARFKLNIEQTLGDHFEDYVSLHRWSVSEPAQFWKSVWDFTDIRYSSPPSALLDDPDKMPGATWFAGARFNFAENLLRYNEDKPAIIGRLENGQRREISWSDLNLAVARTAAALRASGVSSGDRVAAILPNVPETIVAMLATASIGAVWSSCSPDFGANSILDRFGQITPTVLIACDGYFYNGKTHSCREKLDSVVEKLRDLAEVVVVKLIEESLGAQSTYLTWDAYLGQDQAPALEFEQLPFDHPLYILFSSGTTGEPKCIVHGAGGTLLQHLKEHQLHVGLKPGDRLFYFTTCGWMMWNWMASGLASGATLLTYDGSPSYPSGEALWDIVDDEQINVFGVGAKYISAIEKAGVKPKHSHNLDSLRTLLSTGSPLSHESFHFVYRSIKTDICLSSISGGTDIVSCFALGNECLPVFAGELQCPGLGMAVEVRNEDGLSVREQKGDLVCARAFPCMPLGFWNDDSGVRYHAAYFEQHSGVWAQGDYAEVTANLGLIIHGRSDAILNPGGVRIGTAEIYRQVEQLDEVNESICVGQNWQDDVRVVLFVVLRKGLSLDADLEALIRAQIRRETTPRHVPAVIVQVSDIPRTRSGKIAEIAVRDTINGDPVGKLDAFSNPEALKEYRNIEALCA